MQNEIHPNINKRQRQAKVLRVFRRIHRTTGAFLFLFFFLIALTGLLLGWKKNSNGFLLAKSFEGTSANLDMWLPLDSLHTLACKIYNDSIGSQALPEVDRIDVRKEKGMGKFVFKGNYWAIQLDGVTGQLLHIEKRRADFIEHLHDGSYFDHYFGTKGGIIKLIYTSIMGLALLTFTITGFWLWYGPKRMRKANEA